MEHPALKRIIFIGDCQVGKTSIIHRYKQRTFSEPYVPTYGLDFYSLGIERNEEIVHLQIWDSSGSPRFINQIKNYMSNSEIIVVIYDIQNRQSFENTIFWIEKQIDRNMQHKLFIVGNKSDPGAQERVFWEEGSIRAKQYNAFFMEVSSKSGENINHLFQCLAFSI
ncbi:unnamed protein product [Blepharisma stoltei]|uniref:Uncharacterized protein n=1 Tax=Blepharisma stoltei TaxID=1481888 RepID=A0AAU9KE30_9CILI|nr:unnamed protein product [Blepharisma stoltei]